MKIALSNVVNSPFRNFTLNTLREDKVTALIESIDTTGFWKNIVLRENGRARVSSRSSPVTIASPLFGRQTPPIQSLTSTS
jgi:hypothetical protein